jgi:hypothetical protein
LRHGNPPQLAVAEPAQSAEFRERGHGLGGTGQRPGPLRDQAGQARGAGRHGGVERVHVLPRLVHPGQGQHLECDGPVGPPGHGPGLRHRAAEHLAERRLVQLPANPIGVDQRVVNIPEDQQPAHAVTLSADRDNPGQAIRPRPG